MDMPPENFTGTIKNMEVLSVIHIASSSSYYYYYYYYYYSFLI